ncbi:hypothetical protein D3C75_527210 [compost metagenome]
MNTPENAAVDTTNTQAPAAAPAAPAAPVVPSKMDKAKPLFAGLRDGSIAVDEGKSQRATFIARAQLPEIGMTKNGAATYWQNLVSLEKGGKLYPHTSTKKTEAAKPADAAPAAEQSAEDRLKAEEHAEEVAADAKDEDDVSHLAE